MKIVKCIAGLCGITGSVFIGRYFGKAIAKEAFQKEKTGKEKFKNYYYMTNHWLDLKQNGISITDYFSDNNINTVAIYGMGEMGKRLIKELKNSNIEVKYVVDKNDSLVMDSDIKIITKESVFQPVDVLIVTATFAFNEIQKELEEKVSFPVISLEDVIYGI